MKKITSLVFAALLVFAATNAHARIYVRSTLTGGAAGSLDELDIAQAGTPNDDNLADGDSALVTVISGTTTTWYNYIFDADGTTAESSPGVIRPDDYNGTTRVGVWRLALTNSDVIVDLGDDGGDDTTSLDEIAITGDTNAIYSVVGDKMTIAAANNWPTADTADTLSTALTHELGGIEANISAYSGLIGINAGAASEVDTPAELESIAGLGAFFSDYADDADAATMRTTLGLVIGTNVQAYDAQLADLADGTLTGDFVNTANPWANNEVAEDLTISGGTVDNSIIGGSTAAAITGTTVTANAGVAAKNGALSGGFVDIYEDSDAGTNKTRFIAQAQAGDVTYTLPAADGTAGQFLQDSDGSGTLVWADPAGSGDITAVGDAASGNAFTADGTGNALYFEGTTSNTFEIALTGANPGSDVIVTIPATAGTLLLSDGDGSALTSVDAATGDSATAFFDAGTIEHEYGGLEADVSLYSGLVKITGGATSAVTTTAFAESILDDANEATFKATVNLEIGTDVLAQQTIGIADNNLLEVDHAAAADNDYAKFTANGLEGRSYAEVLSDIGAEAVDAEIARMDTADTVGADWEWQDGIAQSFGNDNDWEVAYDETTDDRLEYVHTAGAGADVYFDLNDNAADSTYTITNSDATYEANLVVEGDITYSGAIIYGGSGDSYIELSNNASYVGSDYQIFPEGGTWKMTEGSGTEEIILTDVDGATLTGTSWDFSAVTNFEVPNGADPTTDAFGELAADNNAWAAGRGAVEHFDGTASTWLVGTLTTDAPSDGQVPKWNTGGTITWENDADSGGAPEWQNVTDPTADATIDHGAGEETNFTYTGNYTTGSQFLIHQLTGNPSGGVLFEARAADTDTEVARLGDGTNYLTVAQNGNTSWGGSATVTLPNNTITNAMMGDNSVDSDDYVDGSVDSVHISTIVESIAWNAAGINVDGAQCSAASAVQINSGPYQHTIICADNDASTMYGHVLMPDSWDGGTVTLELEYLQTAVDTNALNADVAMQCRGAGETVNNTWGTEVAIDDAAVTGSNGVDHTTSGAVTPNGTCAGGDTLYWRVQLDATGTTTAAATLHFLGAKAEHTSNVGD